MNAGLNDEAEIFAGLIKDAQDAGNMAAVHDLTQQGASRLMKIKQVPAIYQSVLPQDEVPF